MKSNIEPKVTVINSINDKRKPDIELCIENIYYDLKKKKKMINDQNTNLLLRNIFKDCQFFSRILSDCHLYSYEGAFSRYNEIENYLSFKQKKKFLVKFNKILLSYYKLLYKIAKALNQDIFEKIKNDNSILNENSFIIVGYNMYYKDLFKKIGMTCRSAINYDVKKENQNVSNLQKKIIEMKSNICNCYVEYIDSLEQLKNNNSTTHEKKYK